MIFHVGRRRDGKDVWCGETISRQHAVYISDPGSDHQENVGCLNCVPSLSRVLRSWDLEVPADYLAALVKS